jgi:hypothetical protein
VSVILRSLALSNQDLYLAYLESDVFRLDEGEPADGTNASDMTGIRHVSTFKKVVAFLARTAHQEIHHGGKPLLTKWKGRASAFKETLLTEMKKYARHQYPFNQHLSTETAVLGWWQSLEGSEHARILPVRIFYLIPGIETDELQY